MTASVTPTHKREVLQTVVELKEAAESTLDQLAEASELIDL